MKKARNAILYGMLALVVSLMVLPLQIFAEETYEPLEVTIPYKHVYTTTDTTVDSLFHYVITPQEGAPLPAEADAEGVYSFQGVVGTGRKDGDYTVFDLDGGILTFTFTKPGVYSYETKAAYAIDNEKVHSERYIFGPHTYVFSFYIVNDEGGGLKLRMLSAEDDTGVKPFGIEFDPVYEGPIEHEGPDTDDNTPLWTYATFMTGSAICIVILSRRMRQKSQQREG